MHSDHNSTCTGAHEAARLETLRRFGILDTPEEPVFDDLTRLAAQVCATPMACISFVDLDRQWFKSRYGTESQQHPRAHAPCATVVADEAMLVVSNLEDDPRYAAHPLVAGPAHARFYAGAPLLAPGGHVLGALAVLDRQPRTLGPGQQESLHALARQVMTQLESRRLIAELERAAAERAAVEMALRKSEERFNGFMDNSPALAFIKDEYGRYVYLNKQVATSFQIPAGDWIGKTDAEIFSAETARALEENDLSVLNDEVTREIEEHAPTPDGKIHYWLSHKFLLRDGDGHRQIGGLSIDITERKNAEQERERLLSELQQAVSVVKTLKGLIPICASCKNIRDDEGYWKQIEFYLCEHSELEFTHGICPACLERLYPDFVAAQRDGTPGRTGSGPAA